MSRGAGASMRADMAEQPAVLAAFAGRRGELVGALRDAIGTEHAGTVVVARGSSDYAALYGRYLLELATGRPVAMAAPSLTTLYDAHPDLAGWLAVGVSQSGATPEIVTVLEGMAAAGARTVAVTNDATSPLADAAASSIDLGAGTERAVPATKTFTAQLAAFAVLAEALGPFGWDDTAWAGLPDAVSEVLADPGPAQRAVEPIGADDDLIALGRGVATAIALESALKLREAAGVRAEGWSSADFRHGPITVARPGLPVLAVTLPGPAAADTDALAAELEQGGSPVLRLAPDPAAALPIPAGLAEAPSAVVAVVRAQQLALEVALARGLDPDHPAALSKVTPTR